MLHMETHLLQMTVCMLHADKERAFEAGGIHLVLQQWKREDSELRKRLGGMPVPEGSAMNEAENCDRMAQVEEAGEGGEDGEGGGNEDEEKISKPKERAITSHALKFRVLEISEFSTTSLRFAVLGMACPLALVPESQEFENTLCEEVADVLKIPSGGVRILQLTNRRTYVCLEISVSESESKSQFSEKSRNDIQESLRKGLVRKPIGRHVTSVHLAEGYTPPMLPGQRASVKLFNSSTFSDMHAERDFLNHYIYPALRVLLARRRVDFSWIDFRWGGVTSKDHAEGMGVFRCLEKIDQCGISLPGGVKVCVRSDVPT